MVCNLALIEAERYVRKREARGTSSVSVTSSVPYQQLAAYDRKGKRPMVASGSETKTSVKESMAPPTEVPQPGPTTVITVSTSQESGHFQPMNRPPPANWGERVRLQRARLGELKSNGYSNIPDQGVMFMDSCLYDMRERSPPPTNRSRDVAEPTVKDETSSFILHNHPEVGNLVTTCARHTHFIGNTSITPMSQQHYPGRLNNEYDPLIGPRFETIEEGSEYEDD